MPSASKAQHKFMAAVANSPSFAKKAGVPRSVGKDFTAADKTLKLPARAGSRPDLQKVNNPKTNQGRNELFNKGGDTMATKMNPGFMAMIAKKKEGKHKMPDGKMMKNSAMKMASGGFTRSADGVAQQGTTKATQIKMKSGGRAC
jgi:hypothetical protein